MAAIALGRGHEVIGETQVVIDLDQQVPESDRAHLLVGHLFRSSADVREAFACL
jgi:hypothetical protein